jgi:hypothetical protein
MSLVERTLHLREELADRQIAAGCLSDRHVVRRTLEGRGAYEPSRHRVDLDVERLHGAQVLGQVIRDDGAELDDRVAPLALAASRPNDHPRRVQRQVGRIEEEHLTNL